MCISVVRIKAGNLYLNLFDYITMIGIGILRTIVIIIEVDMPEEKKVKKPFQLLKDLLNK